MDYELTVDIPTAGDTSVLIVGIGEIKNGTTVKVDSEQAAQFKNLTGVTLGRANFPEGVKATTVRTVKAKAEQPTEDEAATPDVAEDQTSKGDA